MIFSYDTSSSNPHVMLIASTYHPSAIILMYINCTILTNVRVCTANSGSAGIPVMLYDISKRAISRNHSHHYRLHCLLIATGSTTTIYAHDHIWTDMFSK